MSIVGIIFWGWVAFMVLGLLLRCGWAVIQLAKFLGEEVAQCARKMDRAADKFIQEYM